MNLNEMSLLHALTTKSRDYSGISVALSQCCTMCSPRTAVFDKNRASPGVHGVDRSLVRMC